MRQLLPIMDCELKRYLAPKIELRKGEEVIMVKNLQILEIFRNYKGEIKFFSLRPFETEEEGVEYLEDGISLDISLLKENLRKL